MFCAGRLLCAALLMAEVLGIVWPTGGVLGRRGGGCRVPAGPPGRCPGPQWAARQAAPMGTELHRVPACCTSVNQGVH